MSNYELLYLIILSRGSVRGSAQSEAMSPKQGVVPENGFSAYYSIVQ